MYDNVWIFKFNPISRVRVALSKQILQKDVCRKGFPSQIFIPQVLQKTRNYSHLPLCHICSIVTSIQPQNWVKNEDFLSFFFIFNFSEKEIQGRDLLKCAVLISRFGKNESESRLAARRAASVELFFLLSIQREPPKPLIHYEIHALKQTPTRHAWL